MKKRSAVRRAVAFVALAMLVFVQGAMAAHLCAGFHASTSVQEAADPCDSMGHDDVPPCTAHCEDAALSVDQWPSVAYVAPFTPMFVAVVHVREARSTIAPRAEPSLLHSTSPPLAIRNCCFRI